MANWKKVKKVAGIVIGLAGFVIAVVSIFRDGRPVPGSRARPRTGPAAGGSVWFVGTGQTKKPGSWSSGRHR